MKFFLKLLLVVLFLSLTAAPVLYAETVIVCASTTSTQNSGLFEHILPLFEKKTGITVKVVAVGTGAALEIGKRGDADVVLVHAKDDELKMVSESWFVNRHDLMYNDFIIVGSSEDKAGIRGLKDAQAALKKIAGAKAIFISRGDDSGTHKKELSLWKEAQITPKGQEWYLEVGQGMAKTLRIANEKQAYAITDRGTFLSLEDRESNEQVILIEGDPGLFNQYGVMAVNPKKHPAVKYKEAMEFVNWLVSEEGQDIIASFKDSKGNQLFFPNAR
ncbi:MAG: tungsten ABC transporter substrate-binding protein [Nitrospiraceae bacterium]|nr:MAG: tungsten ABC transporter substrate-binding protein [Nitrospiraceae bacterium]